MRRLSEPSHLDLCCLQNPVIIACGSEKVNLSKSICLMVDVSKTTGGDVNSVSLDQMLSSSAT